MKKRIVSLLLASVMVIALLGAVPASAAEIIDPDNISMEAIFSYMQNTPANELRDTWNNMPALRRVVLMSGLRAFLEENDIGSYSTYEPFIGRTGMMKGFIDPADYTDAQVDAALALLSDLQKKYHSEDLKQLLERFFRADFYGDGTGTPFLELFSENNQKKISSMLPFLNLFMDLKPDAFYLDAVDWAVSNSITKGISPTSFGPLDGCTRGQVVTFLWRAQGSPAPGSVDCPFTDVKQGDYYYDAMLWAVRQGITNGTSETTFEPDATCTRGQIVTFLYRSHGSPSVAGAANPFSDVSPDSYYYHAVLWAVDNNVTTGTSATTFEPDTVCTRGQIVTFLYRSRAV